MLVRPCNREEHIVDVTTAIFGRRSIRYFTDEDVSDSDIETLIEAGTMAPCSCNLQRWAFILLRGEQKNALHTKAGASKHVLHAPAALLILTDGRYSQEVNANIQSVSAAVQNMLLTAHDMGLGTLWMASIGEDKILRKLYDVPDHYLILSIVLVGHPERTPEVPFKKDISRILHHGSFSDDGFPATTDIREWSEKQIDEFQWTYLRARSGFSWRKLNKQQKAVWDFLLEDQGINNWLDFRPAPGRHLFFSKKAGKTFAIYEPERSTAEYLRTEVAGDPKLPIQKIGSKKYDTVVIFESLESRKEQIEAINQAKSFLSDDGEIYIVFRNVNPLMKLYISLSPRSGFTLLHRYFGPVGLLSYRRIKKLANTNGLSCEFLAGSGITPWDSKIRKGWSGRKCKLGVVRLKR